MDHLSNRDIDNLQALILELDKIIFKLNPEAELHTELKNILAEIKFDIEALQDLVERQADLIYQATPSTYLKGVVNSVFDTISVEETLAELKGKKQ